MIRQLKQDDKDACLQLVRQEPAEDLFIIGDIEAFGMETDFQKIWAEFNKHGDMIAVLLKYQDNYIAYANSDCSPAAFAEIMRNDRNFQALSGLKAITEQIEPYLKPYKSKREMYYAKCVGINNDLAANVNEVEEATREDAAGLLYFLDQIPEFNESVKTTLEKKQRDLESGFSRAMMVKSAGEIVASAATTAENSASAMVVGVATLSGHKRNGYATDCVLKLCTKLLEEKKEPCLFYDNPAAGTIYKRIGFEDIGLWMMYRY